MTIDIERLSQSFIFIAMNLEEGRYNEKEIKYLSFKNAQIEKYFSIPSFQRYLEHKAKLKKHILINDNRTLCNKSGNTIKIDELLIIPPEELKDVCKVCLKGFKKTRWERNFTIW